MGDVSFSDAEFGYRTIHNYMYFKTSHVKGPQDGTGANLKHKVDMEIIKRNVIIQNAKDLFKFTENSSSFTLPARKCATEKTNFLLCG